MGFGLVKLKTGQDLVLFGYEEQGFVYCLEDLNFAVGEVRYHLPVLYSVMEVEVELEVGEVAHFVVEVPQSLALEHMASCMSYQNFRLVEPTY